MDVHAKQNPLRNPLVVRKTKKDYPPGTMIVLEKMEDVYRTMPAGLKGVVSHVDDIGTIHCNWENGSTLGLIPGVDSFHKEEAPCNDYPFPVEE